ncbi:MAG: hydrogen gas-evolving membrane-bound hydrogenase subunit E [Anaerolineae bacterium]
MANPEANTAARRSHIMRRYGSLPVLAVPVLLLLFVLSRAPASVGTHPWRLILDWLPELGLRLDLQLDALSLLFALLVSGLGVLVTLYSLAYMRDEPGLGRYYSLLLVFMVAMLGVVTAGNLLLLFIFWELTSVSSFLLIGFRHEEEASQQSALQALLVTGGGGLALLAGVVLLGQVYGTYELSAILARPELLRGHPYYGWVLGLVLAGACAKSAQFPLHFWLPNAMVAPTPISAYLHSATMVKAGLYLLARLAPVLGGTPPWQTALLAVGGLTMLLGAAQALRQRDLKAILAYTTISSLGMFVTLLGIGTAAAVEAALVLLPAHALYKGALFLVVGIVDHETGTRDALLLGGLARSLPRVAPLALVAAASMAGLPLTLGFVFKELDYAAALATPLAPVLDLAVTGAFVAANGANAALAGVMGVRLFWGKDAAPLVHKPHGLAPSLVVPPALLGAGTVLLGAWPQALNGLLAAALPAVLPGGHGHPLHLWHGWNLPLALSALSLLLGAGLYAVWPRLCCRGCGAPWRLSPLGVYQWLVGSALPKGSAALTTVLQSGSLRNYLLFMVLTMVLLVGGSLWTTGLAAAWPATHDYLWPEIAMAILMIAAVVGVVAARTRLTAIICLGVVGTLVTLLFVRFRAPDLAMTQLLTESLMVILLLLVFHYLPGEFLERQPLRQVLPEMVVAGAAGLVVALTVVAANARTIAHPVADYYLSHSLADLHGHNVVDAILVGFRAFDTVGEVTVLATAALGITALLGLRRRRGRGG